MKVSPLLAVGVMAVAMIAAPLTVAAVSDDAPGAASGDHARHDTGPPAWAGPDREALPPGISKRKGDHFVPPGLAKRHGERALPPGHAKEPKEHGHGKALGHGKDKGKKR